MGLILSAVLWCSMRRHFTIKSAFLISQNELDFVISQNRICDITKSNLRYHKIEFVISQNQHDLLISQNRICDIKKSGSFCDIIK